MLKKPSNSFPLLLPYDCRQQICPSNTTYMSQMPISYYRYDTMMSVYMPQKLAAISSVTRNTDIHTLYIIGTYTWTCMPATLHIYAQLHCYCSLHIDPTLLHIQIKNNNNKTRNYYPYLPHYCHIWTNKKCPSNVTYAT